MSEHPVDSRRPTVDSREPGRRIASALSLVLLAAVSLTGCSLLRARPKIEEKINLITVMPIERDEPVSATPTEKGERSGLLPGAERVVTAQIYGVLSSSTEWRFVPDLTVTPVLGKIGAPGDLATRGRALGKAVKADAVLFGTVSRYVERVGSEFGARDPAAVAFKLQLVSVVSGKILWTGSFDQTQKPLSSNLFNWWQFWRGGPKWFSAQEFTHLGVEHVLEDLAKQLGY